MARHGRAAGLPSLEEVSARPWQRQPEPGGAESVGLEELTSFDFVPDHWIEITLIGSL